MKKTFVCIISLMLAFQTLLASLWQAEVHAFGGGVGSPGDPYIIMTAQHLSDIRNDLSMHYRLGADIDLVDYDYDGDGPDTGGWMPIGDNGARFSGKLDGNGHVIRNMTIDRSSSDGVGLFGYIDNNAELESIRLLDIHVEGRDNVGGLTGWSYNGSAVRNSHVTGVLNGNNGVGGLAGNNNSGTIHSSYAQVNVNGNVYVGGLAGLNGGTIQHSYATGDVNGFERVGGLVGVNMNNSGLIEGSYATGNVSGNQYISGLAGWNYNGGVIRDSYAIGSASGNQYVAGLVAWNYFNSSAISNSYATGFVTGALDVGGLVAVNNNGGVSKDSYWNTETTGQPASATGTGRTTAEMKSRSAYGNLDFDDVWGIREGETYPYLLAYKPEISAAPLAATMYNLSPGQNELSVAGTVRDESIGEQITIGFIIQNSLNATVASATYSLYADGGVQPFTHSLLLTGLSDGDYTMNITATDTYNAQVAATPLAFTVNSALPALADLSLSTGMLSPAFAANITSYAVNVTNSVYVITVTPVTGDVSDTATLNVNGGVAQPVISGDESDQLMLNEGDNTIAITVTGLNGLQSVYTVTVNRALPVIDPEPEPEPEPEVERGVSGMQPKLCSNSSGSIKLVVRPSMIEKLTAPDGTVLEKVTLNEKTLNQESCSLGNAAFPILSIEVNDSERTLQVEFSAASIASAASSNPHAIFEVKARGARFQLATGALDLERLAAKLGADMEALKVNVIVARADKAMEDKVRLAAASGGNRLVGDFVSFKLIAEANGRTVDIRDFGGTYMTRAIVTDANAADGSLTGAIYDPDSNIFSFIPSRAAVREDGRGEMIMRAPHNSLHAVLETSRRNFADMSGHWAQADVELLASKLIVRGVTNDRYAPNADITRAEFTALFVRALGLSMNRGAANAAFVDVADGDWYAPALEAAVNARLVRGISPDRFAPNERITREQMAVIISAALALAQEAPAEANPQSTGLAVFDDRAVISAWARESVVRVVAAGIIVGMPDGSFAPAAYATRAQAAAMLKRFLAHVQFI